MKYKYTHQITPRRQRCKNVPFINRRKHINFANKSLEARLPKGLNSTAKKRQMVPMPEGAEHCFY